jgi:2-acylglycerol O-acyltransferase 2
MSFLTVSFPLSYIMLMFGFLIGVGVSVVFLGSIGVGIAVALMWFGVLRILPIVEWFSKAMDILWPGTLNRLEKNIRESFPVTEEENHHENPAIYMFHPHGLFSITHYFHVGSRLTDWKARNIKGTAIHWLWWLPFGKELLEHFHFVPSHYTSMKKVLEGGEGLSVTLGGVREILYSEPGKMKLNIGRRRGIFKMALETGTPLVPTLVYGENELYEIYKAPWLDWIQQKLVPYALFLPIPTLTSCLNWLGLINNPLSNPVRTVIGRAIPVEKKESVSEEDIEKLRETYFASLRSLYERTHPSWYSELEIV